MKNRITPERAEILALEALAWLAGRPDDIGRFLNVSGLGAADLRQAVGRPDLLGAVLDFLLTNEPLLLDFCRDASTSAQSVHMARHALESLCG
jgi:Protein of unknown function (DUF3572)